MALQSDWEKAVADFGRQNSLSSKPAIAVMICSGLFGVPAAMNALAALKNGNDPIPALLFFVVVTALFFLARNRNAEVAKRFWAMRSELWQPYAERLQALELQIAKNRKLVDE